ncbi:MAG: TrmH family RNA methyltransferase [Burkholderiales bacterium]
MKSILSRDNAIFKRLRKLSESARIRKKSRETLLDGLHLIESYQAAFGLPELFVISEAALSKGGGDEYLHRFPDDRLIVMADTLFNDISPVSTPTGILALISIPPEKQLDAVEFCLFLEDLQDPGNLGSILRSAAAAGVDSVYLSRQCADAWSPKALRAGMGAHFALSIVEETDLLLETKRFNGQIFAASLDSEISLFTVDLTGKTAFIIGNEGAGISQDLLASVGTTIKIPMEKGIESLNAAAAAAICLFERVRQTQA